MKQLTIGSLSALLAVVGALSEVGCNAVFGLEPLYLADQTADATPADGSTDQTADATPADGSTDQTADATPADGSADRMTDGSTDGTSDSAPSCADASTLQADGAPCDSGITCSSGTCSVCDGGAACVVAGKPCPALPGPTGGAVLAPMLTYGSKATYSCNTGYTLNGSTMRTCQNDGTWDGTAPTCDINRFLLTVTISGPPGGGSVLSTTNGVAISCGTTCSALVPYGTNVQLAASPGANGIFSAWTSVSGPDFTSVNGSTCNVTITAAATVNAAFKLKTGAGCTSPGDCTLGHCVNGVCCASACNGVCDESCQANTGACLHRPSRTSCGSVPLTSPGSNDLSLICDTAGQCTGPTITCNNANPCALSASMACCNRPLDATTDGTTCGPVSTCYGSTTAKQYGMNCSGTSDCPLGQVCCYTGGVGFAWQLCRAACDGPGQSQICNPNASPSDCPPPTSCTSAGTYYYCR
jgi:hypothetical protein